MPALSMPVRGACLFDCVALVLDLGLCQVLLVNNFGLDPGVILVLDLNVLPAVT